MIKEPNWQRLCADTAVDDWDCESGKAISRDLWWAAKLFYNRAVTEDSYWLTPFVSPSGDGTIHFSWVYGNRKFNLEITDGLWHYSEKDGSWGQSIDGHLPDECLVRIQAFLQEMLEG